MRLRVGYAESGTECRCAGTSSWGYVDLFSYGTNAQESDQFMHQNEDYLLVASPLPLLPYGFRSTALRRRNEKPGTDLGYAPTRCSQPETTEMTTGISL
eukprot:3826571-Rhodomonas_salina.5